MDATEITALTLRLARERAELTVELERRLQRAEALEDELAQVSAGIPEIERRLAAFSVPPEVSR